MNPDDHPMALIPNEDIKKEVEVPVEFVSPEDEHECMVCLSRSSDSFNIHNTNTGASGTPLNVFIGKFTNTELPFCPEFAKYICKKCLEGINVLEQAEIEYLKLKNGFQSSLQKNPMFLMPQPVKLKCVKDESRKEDNSEEPCHAMISQIKKEDLNVGECSSVDPLNLNSNIQGKKTSYAQPNSGSQIQGEASAPDAEQQCQAIADPTNKMQELGEKPYECNFCSDRFSARKNLQRHLYKHTAEKRFVCDICQRTFNRKDGYQEHCKVHRGEKPYECSVCQHRFVRKWQLSSHFKTHTREKPYQCHLCQQKFAHSTTLLSHVRLHYGEIPRKRNRNTNKQNGETPYKCGMCQRQFTGKWYLQEHVRTHTGEQPYQCSVCQKRFIWKRNLQSHLRTVCTQATQ